MKKVINIETEYETEIYFNDSTGIETTITKNNDHIISSQSALVAVILPTNWSYA